MRRQNYLKKSPALPAYLRVHNAVFGIAIWLNHQQNLKEKKKKKSVNQEFREFEF